MVEKAGGIDPAHRRVIFASSLGTVFEWYDFYLYGSLVAIITKKFFSGMNDTTGFLFALLAFAAGFFVRPFGALVFGRLGDLVGRKHTFLITIVIMGASTALVGCPPVYADDRCHGAHHLHTALRLLQGLAARRSVRRGGDLHQNTPRKAGAVSTRAGSRPRPRWASSSR
jgi:MFS family permease